ncbi:MAG: DNA repair protein RecN [Burkholderiales bacterium]|nr:DNA repair protein RecN [Anaerolineae bacterium]
MLEEIRIQNFAIIDSLELTFAAGFNVITGETGAGKSIIIDAVDLLLGGRADSGAVRAGAEKAVVEGVFTLNRDMRAAIDPVLQREELYDEDTASFVTLSREIRRSGRSAARVNGISVNLDVLSQIGDILVDVHGQSEHLSLLKPRSHIDLIDRYADLLEVRSGLATVVERLNEVRREMRHILEDEAALKRRADGLRREVEEIDSANLQAGEDDDLRAERTRLANSEQLATLTQQAVMLLYGDDSGDSVAAADQLSEAVGVLTKLARIDETLADNLQQAQELSLQAQELAAAIRDYGESLEFNPKRLDEVEERLEAINLLRRRYGATIEAVLEHAETSRTELKNIDHSDERIAELREQETKLLKHIGELASRISKSRRAAGQQMARRIVQELGDLRMERTRFEVAVEQRDDPEGCYVEDRRLAFDATGIDHVEFMMSANPGEPLRPLAKVASGGETARIMLALKRVLTQADQTPTLIFDEIDQGIGGRVGAVVGEKLWSLSINHQVLVVTHLPQLAGYADQHYRVSKTTTAKRVTTTIVPLEEESARVDELAEMLGASGEGSQISARDILAQARTRKLDKATDGTLPEGIKQSPLWDEG